MKTIDSRLADLERENRALSIKINSILHNLSNLATRQSNRDGKNEESIGKVDGKADATDVRVDEVFQITDDLELDQADLLLDICMIELGIEKEESEEIEDE